MTANRQRKPILAVDLDDCCAEYSKALVRYADKKLSIKLDVDTLKITENWEEMFGFSEEKATKEFDKFSHEWRWPERLTVVDGARKVLLGLKDRLTVVAVSSRSSDLRQMTLDWIEQHYAGVFEEIILSGIYDGNPSAQHASRLTKADVLRQIGASYLIDDQPKHVNGAAEIGVRALLFGDYAWNRDAEIHENVTRVANWEEIAEYFGTRL